MYNKYYKSPYLDRAADAQAMTANISIDTQPEIIFPEDAVEPAAQPQDEAANISARCGCDSKPILGMFGIDDIIILGLLILLLQNSADDYFVIIALVALLVIGFM